MTDRDSRRLQKQAQRDERVAGLYQTSPQLKALDEALAGAGREGLMKAWDGGDTAATVRRIARLQEEKDKLLAGLGLDESVYDIPWDCGRCEDRGYLRPGEPCDCMYLDDRDRRLADSGLSSVQKTMSFDNFSLDWYDRPTEAGRLAEQVKAFCDRLVKGEACGNLFLFGPVGSGKTHLCSAAANRVLAAGKEVVYIRTEELLEALREDIYGRGDFSRRTERAERQDRPERSERSDRPDRPEGTFYGRGELQGWLLGADLLILEDLGAERLTDFAEEQITNLIDQRILRQKPWIITSHLIGEKFNGRYDPRLVDRVRGEGKPLFLNENSIRFKKAQKSLS